MIYLAIFLSKIAENALSTLRIILVSSGKKTLGALLQGLVMLIWILVTGYVIIDIDKDIIKIIAFCLGALCGSYLGSIIEEKLALGFAKLTVISEYNREIFKQFKEHDMIYNQHNLTIMIKRKNIKNSIKKIKSIDKKSQIISERIKIYD